MPRELTVDCTDPNDLLSQFPCLKCASIQELYIILVGMFLVANNNQQDPLAILDDASRLRLSTKEWLQALIAALPTSWFQSLTEENLRGDFGCLRCVPTEQLKAVFLNQWCEFWKNYAPA